MATTIVTVLSSSPTRPYLRTTPSPSLQPDMSSSPALPSPSQLFIKPCARLSSGRRISPVPSGSITDFTTVSSLLYHTHSAREDTATAEAIPDVRGKVSTTARQRGPTKPRKVALTKLSVSENTGKPRKVRKSKVPSNHDDHEEVIDRGTNERETIGKPSKAKTTRAANVSEPRQTTIKASKITKPSTSDKGRNKGHSKVKCQTPVTERIPRNMLGHLDNSEAKDEGGDLGLSEAVKRRKNWTPPKDTEVLADIDHKPRNSLGDVSSRSVLHAETEIRQLESLFSDYGYAQIQSKADADRGVSRRANGEALTKRRKVELITAITCDPPVRMDKRSKSPKKKAQTITDKATAAFVPENASSNPSLLQYFSLETPIADPNTASGDLDRQDPDACQRQHSPLQKPVYKKAAAKTKKVKKLTPILSPETLQQAAREQDFVFGTSSQLARDESPSFLRDLQEAIRSSGTVDGNEHKSGSDVTLSLQPHSFSTIDTVSSRNLWRVGTRDLQGSLLDADIVDLSVTPSIKKRAQLSEPKPISEPIAKSSASEKPLAQKELSGSDWISIEESSFDETTTIAQEHITDGQNHKHLGLENEVSRPMAEWSCGKRSNTQYPVKKCGATSFTASTIVNPVMPEYQGFSTVQLTKAVAAFGFKPIKSRAQMIALLQKCWESKTRMALQTLPTNTNLQAPIQQCDTDNSTHDAVKPMILAKKRGMPPKPKVVTSSSIEAGVIQIETSKNPRGRPKKGKAYTSSPLETQIMATKPPPAPPEIGNAPQLTPKRVRPKQKVAPIEEISDSDTSPTPSPPRRSSPTTPKALLLTAPSHFQRSITPSNLTPNSAQTHLLSKITLAITTFPPAHDPKNLTWHEKILLYDPIVLEDLTRWLNLEGLGRIGVDEEVGTGVVKAWCEGEGICCLWGENLRGGARARW